MQRPVAYALGAVLYLVLQAEFWIAEPGSVLRIAVGLGSNVLALAYAVDSLFRNRATIAAFLLRLLHKDENDMPKYNVRLVCRAVAVLWGGFAVVELTYLPERLVSLFHYVETASLVSPNYLLVFYETSVTFLLIRIALLSLGAALFWKCGPKLALLISAD